MYELLVQDTPWWFRVFVKGAIILNVIAIAILILSLPFLLLLK